MEPAYPNAFPRFRKWDSVQAFRAFKNYAARDVQVTEDPLQPSEHELALIGEDFEDHSEQIHSVAHDEKVHSDTAEEQIRDANVSTADHRMDSDILTNLVEIPIAVDNGEQCVNTDLGTEVPSEVGEDAEEFGNKNVDNRNVEVDEHDSYSESGQDKDRTYDVVSDRDEDFDIGVEVGVRHDTEEHSAA